MPSNTDGSIVDDGVPADAGHDDDDNNAPTDADGGIVDDRAPANAGRNDVDIGAPANADVDNDVVNTVPE